MYKKDVKPLVTIAQALLIGGGGSSVPIDGKEKSTSVLISEWFAKYNTEVYLKDTEDQPWDATYFAILDSIFNDPNVTVYDLQIPYDIDKVAILCDVTDGVYYFWVPSEGKRLGVFQDSGDTTFESLEAKDFATIDEVESLSDELDTLQDEADGLQVDVDNLNETVFGGDKIYGFHIDSTESDPYKCVTYLEDAINMVPAHMDYTTYKFDYGTWEKAFFMPKPCMLRYDGTVDYYLDPNDYSKREDGTPSDVSNVNYEGNAMIEWGQNGKKIWYKIVPGQDDTSADVYIASYRADDDYQAWSFVNEQGELVNHFYTPIYDGSIDGNGRLRSLSGIPYSGLCASMSGDDMITAAELNNPSTEKMWNIEVYCDYVIISLLLILMGKSLNSQEVYGKGIHGGDSFKKGSGSGDEKGFFWGHNNYALCVKVFGMENYWGNIWRRYAGYISKNRVHYYKLTYGTEDGSTETGYNNSGTGYIQGKNLASANNYITKMRFSPYVFAPSAVNGSASTYWCDHFLSNTGTRGLIFGGRAGSGDNTIGLFNINVNQAFTYAADNVNASVSCKPLA